MKTQNWGYSKDGAKVFELDDGEKLPDGYYSNPASVPGSDAEKIYKADAEREGAKTPLITAEQAPPKADVKPDIKPDAKPDTKPDAKPDNKSDKADATK